MKEVEAYKLFARSPGIIHSVDYSVASERSAGSEPGAKTVYVLLPYYRRGNLQDMINANLVNHTRFGERRLMALMAGVCRALREMHKYKGRGAGGKPTGERMEVRTNGIDENVVASKGTKVTEEEDEMEQQQPLMGEDEGVPQKGELRSYAHRDIKPGTSILAS
jgi:serine/threonine kinase 16